MRECPRCRVPHDPQARYCSQCGARLTAPDAPSNDTRTRKALDLVEVYHNLGLVYYKKGQYHQAVETWARGLARDPGNERLQKRIEEARTHLA